jgi:D-alanyl-D-alanine carboxypeptidase
MPYTVLQPVERRRRRGRLRGPARLIAPLALAALLGGASLVASEHWARAHDGRARDGARARAVAVAAGAAPTASAKATEARQHLRVAVARVRRAAARPVAPVPQLLLAGPPRYHVAFRPPLRARSAILVDARNGAVLWAAHAHVRRPIASTTKIMTGLLALEYLPRNRVIRINPLVPRVALVREGLRAGERVPAWKLLYGLLVYSGNDDALALAIGTSGSRGAFLRLMNEKARALGLRDTHFTSPSGVVDQGNYSTAFDLAALARYAMRDPRFRAIVRTRIARLRWTRPTYSKIYVNKNPLLGTYRGADGIKTGFTTLAGHCLVASAHRGSVRLIAVVLDSTDPAVDARRLFNFGFAHAS